MSLSLLAIVLRDVEWATAYGALHTLPIWAWILATIAWMGSYLLRALRLRAEWRAVAPRPLLACLRLVLTHNAWLLVLPLRAGEASYVWLVHRFWGVSAAEAAASLLRLRVQDALVLMVLGLVWLVPWVRWWPSEDLWWLWTQVLVLAAILVAASFGIWRLARRASGWALEHLASRFRVLKALRMGLGAQRRLGEGLIYGLSNWILRLVVVGGLLTTLTGLSPITAWRAALGTEWGAALPLQGPGSFGTYEAGAWAALQLHGENPAAIMAAVLGVHGFCLTVGLIAAGLAQWLLPAPQVRDCEPSSSSGRQRPDRVSTREP